MPKPYVTKAGGSMIWGTQALRHRPQHAYCIGLVAAEWAYLEQELTFVFAQLMGTQQFDQFGQFTHSGNALAGIALDQIYGTPPKIRLIKAALADKLTSQESEEMGKALDAIKSVGERRNAVVHGIWAIDNALPDSIILRGRKALLMYSTDDLEEITIAATDAIAKINAFLERWLAERQKAAAAKST